jgi:hypothetical protein
MKECGHLLTKELHFINKLLVFSFALLTERFMILSPLSGVFSRSLDLHQSVWQTKSPQHLTSRMKSKTRTLPQTGCKR